MTPHLAEDIKRDEGCKLVAYKDTLDIWTVGVGHAHVAPGTVWTQAQCDAQLDEDIRKAVALLDVHVPWWRQLNDARQDVMVNLCFNMGFGDGTRGLSSFKRTLAFIEAGNFAAAADNLLASKWAGQVKSRSGRLATQLRTGVRVA
jgi:lysozyme